MPGVPGTWWFLVWYLVPGTIRILSMRTPVFFDIAYYHRYFLVPGTRYLLPTCHIHIIGTANTTYHILFYVFQYVPVHIEGSRGTPLF